MTTTAVDHVGEGDFGDGKRKKLRTNVLMLGKSLRISRGDLENAEGFLFNVRVACKQSLEMKGNTMMVSARSTKRRTLARKMG